jgi:hypothetical protein
VISKPQVPKDFYSSCFVGIWLNAFLNSQESLERCFDSLKGVFEWVWYENRQVRLFDFLTFLKDHEVTTARIHLPVSGALDGLIDSGEFLDFALASGEAVTLLGRKSFALVPNGAEWHLFPIKLVSKSPVPYWRETEAEFTNFVLEIGSHIEAFDLVAKSDNAREILINLDHKIGYLEFPENQPPRVTELLGRLFRTLVIGLLAKAAAVPSASSKKDQIFREKVEELITRSRAFLSQLSNYAYRNDF